MDPASRKSPYEENMDDNSFIRQSLSETLQNHPSEQSSPQKANSGKTRRLLNIKELASRKAKADEETGSILKTLGIGTPSSRRTSHHSIIDHQNGGDWEKVGSDRGSNDEEHDRQRDSSSSISCLTPKPPMTLPSGPEDFLKHISPSTNLGSKSNLTRHASLKSSEADSLGSLRRKLADSERARDELLTKCKRLERELNESRSGGSKTRSDGKTLDGRKFEELEKQFDAQEKVCGTPPPPLDLDPCPPTQRGC